MGYKILRVSIYDEKYFNRFEDLKIADQSGEIYLVELKAYNDYSKLTKRDFNQLLQYMKIQNVNKGVFITTSEYGNLDDNRIRIIRSEELKSLLEKYKMNDKIRDIDWIKQKKVNLFDSIKNKDQKRKEIVEYLLSNPAATKQDIEKQLHLDLRTYYRKKTLDEIKKESGISTYNVPTYKGLLHEHLYNLPVYWLTS